MRRWPPSRRLLTFAMLLTGWLLGAVWLWRVVPTPATESAGLSASILRVIYDPQAFNGVGIEPGGWRVVIGVTNQSRNVIAHFGITTLEVHQGTEWVPWPTLLDGMELGSNWAPHFGMVYPPFLPWPSRLPARKPVRLRLWVVREPNALLYFLNYHTGREFFQRSRRLTAYSSEWMTAE